MSLLGNCPLVLKVLLGRPHGSGTLEPTDVSIILTIYIRTEPNKLLLYQELLDSRYLHTIFWGLAQ